MQSSLLRPLQNDCTWTKTNLHHNGVCSNPNYSTLRLECACLSTVFLLDVSIYILFPPGVLTHLPSLGVPGCEYTSVIISGSRSARYCSFILACSLLCSLGFLERQYIIPSGVIILAFHVCVCYPVPPSLRLAPWKDGSSGLDAVWTFMVGILR